MSEQQEQPIEYKWHDCNCMFVCPVCGTEVYADSENEERECPGGCGMRYFMTFNLEIILPSKPAVTP
jgi:DNA-directed RNA polymerase subunit RPC12/RpoP